MTDLEPGIYVFEMPLCAACQRWKAWLEMEGIEYTGRPLAELPADIGSSVPEALLRSTSERALAGESFLVAPTVLRVRDNRRVVLIAEGTEPLFWHNRRCK